MSGSPNSSDELFFEHRGGFYPTVRFVEITHEGVLEKSGGRPGVHSPAALESATRKPRESAFGEDAYATLFWKVAAIGYTLAHDHVFSDGNKRTSAEVMQLCLGWNGYPFQPNPEALTTVMILVAGGHLGIEGLRFALLHLYGENPSDHTI